MFPFSVFGDLKHDNAAGVMVVANFSPRLLCCRRISSSILLDCCFFVVVFVKPLKAVASAAAAAAVTMCESKSVRSGLFGKCETNCERWERGLFYDLGSMLYLSKTVPNIS